MGNAEKIILHLKRHSIDLDNIFVDIYTLVWPTFQPPKIKYIYVYIIIINKELIRL